MHYMVAVKVKDPRVGYHYLKEDLLDGLVPDHVIALMACEVVRNELKLCDICESEGARCHVLLWIEPNTYAKYCPVLWHDVFKPTTWRVEDLV